MLISLEKKNEGARLDPAGILLRGREHLAGHAPGIGHAIGNADAAEAAARQRDPREPGERAIDRRHAIEVAHFAYAGSTWLSSGISTASATCTCTSADVARYRARLSGPLADRIERLVQQRDAVVVRKQRLFGVMRADADHQRVDELTGPFDDVQMAICERVE